VKQRDLVRVDIVLDLPSDDFGAFDLADEIDAIRRRRGTSNLDGRIRSRSAMASDD
jgi:hypothetical protein